MVQIREIEYDDIRIINQWRNDKDIIDYLGANFRYINKSIDEKWYEYYLNNREKNVRLMIIENNKSIGIISLLNIDSLNQSADLGIQIGNVAYQSKGFGTKAVKMMLKHGFQDLNLNRISLEVLVNNKKAIGLYEKCSFLIEGTMRDIVYKNGKFLDMVVMSILKKDFDVSPY